MSEIIVNRDMKLIKVLAAQARNERLDSNIIAEANEIVDSLKKDANPQALHQLAQVVAYGVEELQGNELDFMNKFADIKNISYGDKAAFNVRTGHVKAYIQARGSTTARSMVGSKQVLVETEEISARPAIGILDLRAGRVNMADLIREANREMTNKKLQKVEKVMHAAIANYAAPFYGTGTGIVKPTLDDQIAYFRRLGPVTILGDTAAVGQMASLTGMAMSTTQTQRSNEMINEYNENGYIGRYIGCDVSALTNGYEAGTTNLILDPTWLYILPGGVSAETKNLKVVNEGGVSAVQSQNIDDMVNEIRLDTWFGAAFCVGDLPTIGAYKIS